MKKILLFAFLLFPFFVGCGATPFIQPIVTGVIMWKEGEAHKYYNEEASTLYRATKLALKDLKHPISKDEPNDKGGYQIIAGTEDRFKIVIRKVQPHISEVRIRINFMGDKPYAELVYRTIDLYNNSIDFDEQGRPTNGKLRHRVGQ